MKNNRKFDLSHKIKVLNSSFRNAQSLHHTKIRGIQQQRNKQTINTVRNIPIYLFYKKTKLVVKVQHGISYKELVEKLYEQLLNFQYNKCESLDQSSKKVEKVLGFSTQCKNLKEDYLLSIKNGKVTRSLLLQCFMVNKKNKDNVLNYEIYNCLAIGGFSKVYLSRSRQNGQFYALKIIKKKEKPDNSHNASNIINEMKICENINHPFLVKLIQGFQTQSFYCMVFEYCPGGELFFLLKRLKCMEEQSAKFYFIQILLAIQFLHKNLILYRDLKPQNILIDAEGNIKLVDFGLSKKISSERQKTFSYCGSAQYMAPQMILRCGHSFSIDYYSLGALLYEMVTGLPPFYTKDSTCLQQSIINQQINFPGHLNLSPQLKDLLNKLLIKNQKYRLGSYAGINEIKFHPWIGKFNTNKMIKKQIECPYLPDLYEHNFDLEELGEDQQQFTAQVFSELQNKKNGSIKLEVYCPSKLNRNFIKFQIKNIKERMNKKLYKIFEKQNIQTKSINNSFSKLSKRSLIKQKGKSKVHNSPKRPSQIMQKLFPYFAKPTPKKYSPAKISNKKKIFRLGIKQNKIQYSDSVLNT